MSEQKTLARRLFEVVLNQRRLELLDEMCSSNTTFRGTQIPEVQGIEAVRELFSGFFEAFPDLSYTVHAVIGDGDEVAVRWSSGGTQNGVWMGAAPTGKQATTTGTTTLRFADGKIVDHWVDWDALGMLMQLGISPGNLTV